MTAIITPIDFDPAGALTIRNDQDSDPGEWARRVSRVATMDGGVAVNDFGFSEGDRTVVIRWRCTEAQEARAQAILQTHQLVRLTMRRGCFEAVPQRFRMDGLDAAFTLLITRRLS